MNMEASTKSQSQTQTRFGTGGRGGSRGGGRGGNRARVDDEFDQKVLELARVTRVMAGGKRMRFRALVIVGNHKGKVGMGLAKGADVSLAVDKAAARARKSLIIAPLRGATIPHQITVKYKSAEVMLKPAPVGTGIIAGGPVRVVLEAAGVPNVVSKILGSNNKVNNVRAVLKAFASFKLVK